MVGWTGTGPSRKAGLGEHLTVWSTVFSARASAILITPDMSLHLLVRLFSFKLQAKIQERQWVMTV